MTPIWVVHLGMQYDMHGMHCVPIQAKRELFSSLVMGIQIPDMLLIVLFPIFKETTFNSISASLDNLGMCFDKTMQIKQSPHL